MKERDAARDAADARYAEALRELRAEGYTLEEIGRALGVTRQRAHQLLR